MQKLIRQLFENGYKEKKKKSSISCIRYMLSSQTSKLHIKKKKVSISVLNVLVYLMDAKN